MPHNVGVTQVSGTFPELSSKLTGDKKKKKPRGPKMSALKALGPLAAKVLKGGR